MKASFDFLNNTQLQSLVQKREGEEKIGEIVELCTSLEGIKDIKANFVVFGIPEDIGVRANGGNAGANSTWSVFLKSFLNFQSNPFINANEICVLGAFDFSEFLAGSYEKSEKDLQVLTAEIDTLVYGLSLKIFQSGKIPIAIGGGHNNAFPLIKAASEGYSKKISVINLDAHADLRTCEGRHSGNGFSYAKQEGYLDKYYMLGLHENYNNTYIVNKILGNSDFKAIYFDNLIIRNNLSLMHGFMEARTFIDENLCGIELDLDAIKNIQSSAESPSGFTSEDARTFVHLSASQMNCIYLHVCEGIYENADGHKNTTLPKLITYLVSDFIKAFQNK